MRRLRSESSPAVPSPLGRAGSCESFLGLQGLQRKEGSSSPEVREEDEEREEGEGGLRVGGRGEDVERKMTPPIPEWILTAGARSSLTVYKSRKSVRTPGEGSEDGGEQEQRASP
jgi:hypothetical protein